VKGQLAGAAACCQQPLLLLRQLQPLLLQRMLLKQLVVQELELLLLSSPAVMASPAHVLSCAAVALQLLRYYTWPRCSVAAAWLTHAEQYQV
jgi:hypothetical protein